MAERRLWSRSRDRRLDGIKFRRQHPIGLNVVDFCCPRAKLVIELDGGRHASRHAEDASRSNLLVSAGCRVVRFWNADVLANLDGVLHRISTAVQHPHPALSLEGRGGGGRRG